MKRLRHRIAHLMGWNSGKLIFWNARCGKSMVGFLCDCGKTQDIRPLRMGQRFAKP